MNLNRYFFVLIAVVSISILACSCGGGDEGIRQGAEVEEEIREGEEGPGGYQWVKQHEVELDLNDVLALDTEHVWAAGDGGIYYYDGSGWELQYSEADPAGITGGDQHFARLAAYDSEHVWAISWWKQDNTNSGGRIYFFDGSEWRLEKEVEEMLEDITVAGEDSVWVLGNRFYEDAERLECYASRYHFDGESWDRSTIDFEGYSSETGFRSITSVGEDQVWEAWGSSIYFYDGSGWSEPCADVVPNGFLRGISASDPEHVWSFASDEKIYLYDGSTCSEQGGVQEPWSDISAYDPDRVWAATNRGGIYLFDGSSWQLMYQADEPFVRDFSVSAAGPGDVWAVGCHGIYHGSR